MFSFITLHKKHLSKQAASITYTLEKKRFYSYNISRFISRFNSDRVKKLEVQFDLYESSFLFWRIDNQINTIYKK